MVVREAEVEQQDEIFFTTDRLLAAEKIVETYVGRWSLETTFQEAREHLGLETLRNWSTKIGETLRAFSAERLLVDCDMVCAKCGGPRKLPDGVAVV